MAFFMESQMSKIWHRHETGYDLEDEKECQCRLFSIIVILKMLEESHILEVWGKEKSKDYSIRMADQIMAGLPGTWSWHMKFFKARAFAKAVLVDLEVKYPFTRIDRMLSEDPILETTIASYIQKHIKDYSYNKCLHDKIGIAAIFLLTLVFAVILWWSSVRTLCSTFCSHQDSESDI